MNPNSIGRLHLRVIVPLTDWKVRYEELPWMTRLEPDEANGLTKPSAADAFQIRSVSPTRFKTRLGMLSTQNTQAVAAAVTLTVGFRMPPSE